MGNIFPVIASSAFRFLYDLYICQHHPPSRSAFYYQIQYFRSIQHAFFRSFCFSHWNGSCLRLFAKGNLQFQIFFSFPHYMSFLPSRRQKDSPTKAEISRFAGSSSLMSVKLSNHFILFHFFSISYFSFPATQVLRLCLYPKAAAMSWPDQIIFLLGLEDPVSRSHSSSPARRPPCPFLDPGRGGWSR